jgi:hypothetical protein
MTPGLKRGLNALLADDSKSHRPRLWVQLSAQYRTCEPRRSASYQFVVLSICYCKRGLVYTRFESFRDMIAKTWTWQWSETN